MFGNIKFNLIFIIGVCLFIVIFLFLSRPVNLYIKELNWNISDIYGAAHWPPFMRLIFALTIIIISYFITRFIITRVMNYINKNNYSLFNSKASAKVLKYSDA
jgi:hypothetical protein